MSTIRELAVDAIARGLDELYPEEGTTTWENAKDLADYLFEALGISEDDQDKEINRWKLSLEQVKSQSK